MASLYDIIIVGGGMMGSAAAYHASLVPQTRIALIGPDEALDRQECTYHGCWHDEGRIYRSSPANSVFSNLAICSSRRYPALERESGIPFATNVGFVFLTNDSEELNETLTTARERGNILEDISTNYDKIFPFFSFPPQIKVSFEKFRSGYISPRALVTVHRKLAVKNGATILNDVVIKIEKEMNQQCEATWVVTTQSGSKLCSRRILVAVGGYSRFNDLFEDVRPGMVPTLQLRPHTLAYLKISEQEANRLKDMPSMVCKIQFEDNLDYVLPPIKYPNGNFYLKFGHEHNLEAKNTFADVVEWYRKQTGNPEHVKKLTNLAHAIIPNLQVIDVTADVCLTSHTPTQDPYIDMIDDGFGVALGGNGRAAKSCNEIGRLAARLTLLGEWDSSIPREKLKVIWEEKDPPSLDRENIVRDVFRSNL